MLENLDAIPWNRLEHAYGEATDIPQNIRDLASSNVEIRKQALWQLYGNIWHQGTVYEATAYAIPFLLELLEQPDVADKHSILIYLSALAFGNSYLDVHQDMTFYQDQRDKAEFQARMRQELEWVQAARQVVQEGCPVYKQLLNHELPVVRAAAAYLLGLFPECAEQNLDWLRSHFYSNESDEMVRAATVFAIGLLARHEQSMNAWLENIFNSEELLSIRVAAAIGLAQANPTEVSEPIVNLLAESITNPGSAKSIFDQFPWENSELQYCCGRALACVGKYSNKALQSLLNLLEIVVPYQSWTIVSWILDLVFDSQPMSTTMTVEQLSDDQRMALEAIANSRTFWSGYERYSIVTNVANIMKAYSLPQRPERLKAFLSGQLTLQDKD